ncbi:ABC transporter permease [Paramagnetospirillum kuznetsovii]|uniref:ABC transporter permease n=1 Tax=Paramagnetospirillum kuznetsovii TaxID=2053833 RepID=A0A364NWD0_9PROT|nr:ABC transporter permease [Paramagnetospirillum kuznetsovii]RAU21362.1 ABC transporter permease [Paramagnetospirillum kuznetsovii]
MALALDIALRHLLHRRRQTLVSLLGVSLGVAFFIGISSMMQGFQRDFVARIIDVQPHIIVKDEVRTAPRQPVETAYPDGAVALRGLKPREEVRGIRGARNMLAGLEETPGVHVAPALSGNLLLRYGGKDLSVNVTGIDPPRERKVTHIEKDLLSGTLDALYTTSNGIILGEGVAAKAGIRSGDLISAVSPTGVLLKMKVVGIFRSNITLMDNFEVYVLLKKAQVLANRPNVINRINIRLDDVEDASPLAARIERQYGYRSEPWQEQSRNVLGIFVIQNVIMYSSVSAILIVACFGIFNVISTVVFEKTRDIGILKSMGFRDKDIRHVFLLEGLIVGLLGTVIGWAMGWGLIEFMASLKFDMEGFIKSQGLILYRTPRHYALSAAMAILSSTLAAWVPARRASKLNPVDIVRGAG